MRICVSFMVVEYMRHGKSVKEACRLSIERLKQLVPPSSDTMHSSLVVGVLAMDPQGNIGAASTLDSTNLHRNAPFFPVSYWKEDLSPGVSTMCASTDGAMV